DLVLMDIMLGTGMDGVEAADRIRKNHDLPVIFLTAHADDATLNRAKITEPFGYLLKPFEEHSLHSTIQMALYRHQTEQKIRQMERWFSSTLRSMGDGVLAIDMAGRVTFMNMVAETMTGWLLPQALGQPCERVFRLMNRTTRGMVENPAQVALRDELVVQLAPDTVLITRQGKEVLIEDSAAPIRDDQGIITGAVLVFRNAAERQVSEQTLQKLTQAINQLGPAAGGNQKDLHFLIRAISHDLRSPLTALKLYTQMLADSCNRTLDEEGYELIHGISKSLNWMEDMINSYIHFGHATDQQKNPPGVVDMDRLVRQVIQDLTALTNGREVEFLVGQLPSAKGHAALLRQVLANLLSNAIKYTAGGARTVIKIAGRVDGGHIAYEISDNGPGFDPAQAGNLFGEYQRLGADRSVEGVGLGLSIVKRIVESEGGRVWAASQPLQGATFGFSLPAAPVHTGS
ncbi:MAG TPA: ATP-binding protein, partial [Verrucomicrobiae bacterium]